MNSWELIQHGIRGLLRAKGISSLWTTVGDERIHYYMATGAGSGPPILLVHGLGGSANSYAGILVPLAQYFRRVYAVDLPGNGFSPTHAGFLDAEAHVALLVRFQREVIGEPSLWVGNSLGGGMTLWAAVHHPEAVSALALLCPAGAQMEDEAFEATLKQFDIQSVSDAQRLTERLFHKVPVSSRVLAPVLKTLYQSPVVQHARGSLVRSRYLTPEMLGTLRQPALLIWGEGDRVLPESGFAYFREHLPPHAEVRLIPGIGHVPQVENPPLVVELLRRFGERAFSRAAAS